MAKYKKGSISWVRILLRVHRKPKSKTVTKTKSNIRASFTHQAWKGNKSIDNTIAHNPSNKEKTNEKILLIPIIKHLTYKRNQHDRKTKFANLRGKDELIWDLTGKIKFGLTNNNFTTKLRQQSRVFRHLRTFSSFNSFIFLAKSTRFRWLHYNIYVLIFVSLKIQLCERLFVESSVNWMN